MLLLPISILAERYSKMSIDNMLVAYVIVQVVYMDEPSTGLDPSSRSNLWNVVKRAKQDRAIILTSNFTFLLLFLWFPFV